MTEGTEDDTSTESQAAGEWRETADGFSNGVLFHRCMIQGFTQPVLAYLNALEAKVERYEKALKAIKNRQPLTPPSVDEIVRAALEEGQ